MTITVSTDGSALGNPNGPMGWAWADHETPNTTDHNHSSDCDAGGATNGTNQIGELCAVLMALRAHPGSEPLIIETDSQYAINCSTKWVKGWKKNGWKNSKQEPVKNRELIQAIDTEIMNREGDVTFTWVKGHAGNAGNEKVDMLARTYAESCRSGTLEGYLPVEGWESLMHSAYAKGLKVPQAAQALLDEHTATGDVTPYRELQAKSPLAQQSNTAVDIADTQESASNNRSESTPTVQDKPAVSTEPEADDVATRNTVSETASKASSSSQQETVMQFSGLQINGTVQFTPPPQESPSYDGTPKRVRGYIEVEGLVQGDGTFELQGAPFFVMKPKR